MARPLLPILLFLLTIAHAQAPKEADWKPSLAYGGAPDCPEHVGNRISYSATVRKGSTTASIVGTANREPNKGCSRRAVLTLEGRGNRPVPLPIPHHSGFEIADFSPDGGKLLLVSELDLEPPYDQTRNVELAIIDVDHPEVRLINSWDIFGWGKCNATVEPQGFMHDGRVLLRARPSTHSSEVRNDCVPDSALYATDLKSKPVRLPKDMKVPRFAEVAADQREACKSDPDIVEACYTVHGKLNVWNGTPSLRIWPVGTNRLLGIHDEWPLPAELDGYDLWNGAAWGDFEVCPFTEDRPGWMRMVCVESASHIIYKKY